MANMKIPVRLLKIKKQSWLEDKIKKARKLLKPSAKRLIRLTKKFGSLIIAIIIIGIVTTSFFLPKNIFQKSKENLIKNPTDLNSSLFLLKTFLNNHQFQEAEKIFPFALLSPSFPLKKQEIKKLLQQKLYTNPKDIKKLIKEWEKVLTAYPDYRDGWIHLAILNYKISNLLKAKEAIHQALNLDPNYQISQNLKKLID